MAHADLVRACTGVGTLTAEMALSGRAGDQRLRGRVVAGFAAPDAMRLEGVAPFGAPAFILVAQGGDSTLLLPRENAVVHGATPEDLLGALAGVSLSPADLLAVLTGCVEPSPVVLTGSRHGRGEVRLELAGGSRLLLHRAGDRWRLITATRLGWTVDYTDWPGTFPGSVRLRSTQRGVAVDVTVRPTQIESNTSLAPDAFGINVPRSARVLTLEELREAGPLRTEE